MKEICTKVIYYAIIALLLIFGAIKEWKANNKVIAVFTFVAALIMIFQVMDNANVLRRNNSSGTSNG